MLGQEKDRYRFAGARFFLRQVVGRYAGIAASGVEFHTGRKGKPFVTSPSWLSFNLSHSRDVAVLALTSSSRIGVDVEWLDRSECFISCPPSKLSLSTRTKRRKKEKLLADETVFLRFSHPFFSVPYELTRDEKTNKPHLHFSQASEEHRSSQST